MSSFFRALLCASFLAGASVVVGQTSQPTEITSPAASETEQAVEEAMRLLEAEDVALESRIEATVALLESYPQNAEIWSVLGELRLQADNEVGALAAFERSVEYDSTLYSSWHWIGIIEKRSNENYDKALDAFEKSLEHGAPRARALNEIAVTLTRFGRLEEARGKWEMALEEDPEWGVLYANLVKLNQMLGDQKSADAMFEKSLTAERFEPRATLMRADYWLKRDNQDKAVWVYETALRSHPTSGKIRYSYAMTLSEMGETKAAVEELKKAESNAIANKDYLVLGASRQAIFALEDKKNLKKMERAAALIEESVFDKKDPGKKLKRVVKLLDEVEEEHTNIWELYLMRGTAQRRLLALGTARRDLERGLELMPNQPRLLVQLALLFQEESNYYKSVEYARKAVEGPVSDPTVLLNAGFIFLDTLNCSDAAEIKRRVEEITPVTLDIANSPIGIFFDEYENDCGAKN